ncbi:nicotinamide riboside kinase 1 [Elysia marginata]|uniref:Nicotinamide riboside kinase 1 n=1 Tax=Elysia marginata TaxID=1093978 RepID=A0AAV4EVY7_9GAST|nr:nicotinamide riboside kinase 1 [Elysia marginata]
MALKNCFVIGLSGTTNSGKTTLSSMLCKNLPNSSNICQDHYFYGPNDPRVRRDEDGKQNWEELQAMDMDQMMKDVHSWIKENKNSLERSYLIIEGFLIFNHRPLASLFDKKFFIKIDRETCAERRRVVKDIICLMVFADINLNFTFAFFFVMISKRTYNPPDYPGYFENKVWPMYLKNLEDIQDQTDIEYLPETNDLQGMFHYLQKIITGL